jgi:hypothetical protein
MVSKRFANGAGLFQAQIYKYWIGPWSAAGQSPRPPDDKVPR